MTIFDASRRYIAEGVPLIVIAGKEYGSGSSRDWAAKGPLLLGIRAVIAESYERIHRSNLVGMGILPLQFKPGETAESPGLDRRRGLLDRGSSDGDRRPFRRRPRAYVTARTAGRQPCGSRWLSGSTLLRRSVTMNTAASSLMCSGSCSHAGA